jgi:UDP-N-acetylglucosamine--N-acetylmuramyl-(pentapeptide) pyrophosphoryl-undecaprenol N-acetylglucosamine transferase
MGSKHRVDHIVLSAGGTAGHIYPAIALAQALHATHSWKITFVTDRRGMPYIAPYAKLFPRIVALPIRWREEAWRNALSVCTSTVRMIPRLLRSRPQWVMGFGGYPSVPAVWAAQLLGIPTLLHEQNAIVGRANRWLVKKAKALLLSFPSTLGAPPSACCIGNPLIHDRWELSRELYPTDQQILTILITGGSQGSSALSSIAQEAIANLQHSPPIRVFHQCPASHVDALQSFYQKQQISADVASFFADLPKRMAQAHLVISRAGASTVSELLAFARPSILIPLKQSLDGDQMANARYVEQLGGAWLTQETSPASALFVREVIQSILDDRSALHAMHQQLRKQACADPLQRLVPYLMGQTQSV